jgi:hypothetical protein
MVFSLLGGALGLGTGRVAGALAEMLRERATEVGEIGGTGAGGAGTTDGTRELGRVLVLGEDLARALVKRGVVVLAHPWPRGRRSSGSTLSLPLEDASMAAVCAAGMPSGEHGSLGELRRVVRDGGMVAVATAGSGLRRSSATAEAIAAAFVHAALVDVEQRKVGSLLVSSGRVRRFGEGA